MVGDLGNLPWDTIAPWGIAVSLAWALVRMVLSGRFIPRDQVEMLMADLRKSNEFLQSARTADAATMAGLVKQNEKLSMQGELSLALLRALQKPGMAGITHPESPDNVASTQE
ncbi:hypothetical protein NDR87_31000 [Nocardia sp. CDC159]|uniref:Uncharacterized protein n=1 Tax=Nocardia pulmonis TaxID=2951408 RepID=A0A9X2EGP6_9NOCA|nr:MULTISPECIES: hypothetical protein [Nocardia]MCM6778021.1 hypothetical protein [Nocardia pulmonis]MCM6790808.1 hypothetical protein [Nocardia sp. CDC159]